VLAVVNMSGPGTGISSFYWAQQSKQSREDGNRASPQNSNTEGNIPTLETLELYDNEPLGSIRSGKFLH
jgi:hypothetical protein